MIATHPSRTLEPRREAGLGVLGTSPVDASAAVPVRAAAVVAKPVLIAGVVMALATLFWTGVAPGSAERAALVPLLIGMVFLGLPHGALDHLVPARLGAAWGRRPVTVALFLAGYAGLAAGYLWFWTVAPVFAFVGFLVATVLHWGQGDVDFLERFVGRRRLGWGHHLVTVLLRGALPVAIPVLVQTDVAEGLWAAAATAMAVGGSGDLDLRAPIVRWGLGMVLLIGAGLYLAGLRHAWPTWRGRLVDVGEVLLLAALFAWVPAYLAIGTYFLAWHSLRHLARLLLLREDDARAVAGGDLRRPVLRLARDLTPVTLLALGFLAALTVWAGARIEGVDGFVALYLVWISALTMPHLLVVAWMDRVRARPSWSASRTRLT